MDELNPEKPSPNPPQALNYQPPNSSQGSGVLNALALLCGMGISFAAIIVLGVVIAMSGFESRSSRQFTKPALTTIAVLWFGLLGLCIWQMRRMRQRNALGRENPHHTTRFFTLGLLIGCGLGALLQGACFGIGAMS